MICPNSLCPSHNQPEIAPALSKYLTYKSFFEWIYYILGYLQKLIRGLRLASGAQFLQIFQWNFSTHNTLSIGQVLKSGLLHFARYYLRSASTMNELVANRWKNGEGKSTNIWISP